MIPKIEIIGDVNKIAQYIPWAKKQWYLREGHWYKHIGTCLIELFRSGDGGFIRMVVATKPSGFAVHPRSSLYFNGINTETNTPIATLYPLFPHYDDDKGTKLLSFNGESWGVETPDSDNYGLHAWTSDDEIISWRGWPSITLGVNRETSIEGVTQLDVQTQYNTFYTPLSSYIYIEGEKVPAPGKVRGAGVSDLGLVVVSTVNYTQYDVAGFADNAINPEGGRGGYYDELYVQVGSGTYVVNGVELSAFAGITNQAGESLDGWLRIGYRVSPVNNLPVWFNSTGKQAVADEGVWDWSVSDRTITSIFTARIDSIKHEYTVYGTPNPWRVTADTRWQSLFMHQSYGLITFYKEDNTNSTSDRITSDAQVNTYIQNIENGYITISIISPTVHHILAGDSYGGGPWEISGYKGSVLSQTTSKQQTFLELDVTGQCGTSVVTAIGSCTGETHTAEQVLPNGTWCFVNTIDYRDGGTQSADYTEIYISGSVRIVKSRKFVARQASTGWCCSYNTVCGQQYTETPNCPGYPTDATCAVIGTAATNYTETPFPSYVKDGDIAGLYSTADVNCPSRINEFGYGVLFESYYEWRCSC